MILYSNNNWSYFKPKNIFFKIFNSLIKHNNVNIETQYKNGVRCFKLRVKFDLNGNCQVCNRFIIYDINPLQLMKTLNFLNDKHCCLHIVLDTRSKLNYERCYPYFRNFCSELRYVFKNIKFICDKNPYNKNIDFKF